jgi:8-oxo-dGTP pyrophosphatase MutT (NUDIX family)
MKTDLVIEGLLIHNNKVLLIHHKKLNSWFPPGGHIEKNETPDDAVKREFKEELSLDVEILNKNDIPMGGNIIRQLAVPFYVNVHRVGDHDHCCFFYLCKLKNTEKLKINKSELKDFGWFSVKELNQDFIPADVRNIARKAFELYNCLKKS